jgi:(5-formylfuran-3-yl)methyl phosphate synthase
MLDTADKRRGGLRAHRGEPQLKEFVTAAREKSLWCGLAGSLKLADIDALLPLAPDYLGFRGALCDGERRTAQLDRDAFVTVRRAIAPAATRTPARAR